MAFFCKPKADFISGAYRDLDPYCGWTRENRSHEKMTPVFMFRFDKAGDPTQPLDLFIDDPLPSQ